MPKSALLHCSPRLSRAGATALALALCLALGAPPAHAADAARGRAPAVQVPQPPANRQDLQGWLSYQREIGSPSLRPAAQIFYRRGVETLRTGATEDGVRMLRGACELDPTFLAPRLALLSHFGFDDASQSLMELARVVDLAKSHFPLQHYLVTAFAFRAALAVFLATLAAALYVAWRRREALRHGYEEFLGQSSSPRLARIGAWALLSLPFLIGLGLALPAAFTLGALWAALRKSERALLLLLLGLLVAIPLGFSATGHLATPDHPERAPFYGAADLASAPFSDGRLKELTELSARHPESPFLHFAAAWMAYRGQRHALAEQEFEAAGRLWPNEPRIPNNLGNLAEIAGRNDEAERLYRQAASLDPRWAMPRYNLGQLYTRQFRYAEASEELARAASFDFDLVRDLQAEAQFRPGDPLPLAWGWLAPRTMWDELLKQKAGPGRPPVPPAWRGWLELGGMPVALLAVVLALLGLALGQLARARLPVRQCSNCEGAVCRRCAARRRDQVYCGACSAALREASTPEFARLLLARRRRTVRRNQARTGLALAAALPGYGPMLLDRLVAAWTLLLLAAAGILAFLRVIGPFPYDPRVGALAPARLNVGALGLVAVIGVLSLLLYLVLRGTQDLREIHTEAAPKPAARLPRAA